MSGLEIGMGLNYVTDILTIEEQLLDYKRVCMKKYIFYAMLYIIL